MSFDEVLGFMELGFRNGFPFDEEILKDKSAPNRTKDPQRTWFYQSIIEWFQNTGASSLPRQSIIASADALLVALFGDQDNNKTDSESAYRQALRRANKANSAK